MGHSEFSTPKAALVNGARWGHADGSRPVITVGFLGGDPALQDKIRDVACEWMCHANVAFDFQPGIDVDVRVAFVPGDGSWSLLGTECLAIPAGESTVNFGWLGPQSTDEEIRPVVLHEFGHVLGLIHEHQSPANGGIRWNCTAVIEQMAQPPNEWDEATTRANILSEFSRTSVSATPLDPRSIMMYPIPASWTLDGFSAGLNTSLTDEDKLLIATSYPP